MLLEKLETLESELYLLTFADGVRARASAQLVLDYGLFAGLELDGETFDRLLADCRYTEALRAAAAMLTRRPLSAGELTRRLREKGADEQAAARAIARLLELGLLDEAAYAEAVVRRCTAKGYGRRRAENELARHLVPRQYWAEALEGLPESTEALDALVRKKLRGTEPDRDTLRKLAAALCRRGFGWEEVRAAIARVVGDDGPEED